jgi:predicted HicB family RNase H-like nuclease
MSDPKTTGITSVSGSRKLEEIGEFWDTHSLDDYWDQTQDAAFEVRARQRRRVTLDPDLYTRLAAQAQERGISPETLVNLWLVERLADTPSTSA